MCPFITSLSVWQLISCTHGIWDNSQNFTRSMEPGQNRLKFPGDICVHCYKKDLIWLHSHTNNLVCISSLGSRHHLGWSLACLLYNVLSFEHPWLPQPQLFPNSFSSISELPSLPLQCPQIPWQADSIIPRSPLSQLLALTHVAVLKASETEAGGNYAKKYQILPIFLIGFFI